MSSRNKRRYMRKKHNRIKRDVKDVENEDKDEEQIENQFSNTNSDVNEKSLRQKRNFLDIIEKTTKLLKLDTNNQLLTLLEDVLTIMDHNSEIKTLSLKLLNMFFTYILACDKGEIYELKVALSSKYLSKDLKDLLVDGGALIVTSFFPMNVGKFGVLKEGILKKPKRRQVSVIIKESLRCEFDQHILTEAKVLAQFAHENVVKILAFQKGSVGVRFAMEYMSLGNLEDALKEFDFSDLKLLLILKEVADGMRYIAEKKYVHRDLRCENVLLNSSGTCKISGFSLCRYVGDTGVVCEDKFIDLEGLSGLYAAPESLKTKKFTTKSDVWAMGLLSWELLYCARSSWQRDSFVPREVLKLLSLRIFASKGILPNPGRCSPFLWMYIQHSLLNKVPEKRPTFAELRTQLNQYEGRLF